MTADGDVVYHGHQVQDGGSVITVETPDGEPVGVVRHVVRHSPTGMGWGYGGSGPADCARSLLIAALGSEAECPLCARTGKVAYRPSVDGEPEPVPYSAAASPQEYERDGLVVASCWQWDCDEGYRRLPYQEFKSEFVAGWKGEWRMSRADIVAWLAGRGWPRPL